jgi:small subunit ribosomal protein S1
MEKTENKLMDTFMVDLPNPPQIGDLIEGNVVAIDKAAIYIDLPPFGTGIIFGREYIIARDLIRKIHVGDSVTAKVAETLNKDGYIELSLKEAKQALIWGEVEEVIKNKTPLELVVQDANKGGLLMVWQGLQGFLPASQLKPEHYPRVVDGDKIKILEELRRLVGEKLSVTVIGATPEDGKLIFSEKSGGEATSEEKAQEIDQYNEGDILEGEVTGVVDFGIFVKIVGDRVKVKVIEIKDGKISLSIKALTENPWLEAGEKYKKDDVVKGVIIKYNKHGALASIEEGVAGLIHVSEFEDADKLKEVLELGKVYDFKITLFEPKDQKMTLSTKLD